ncbi:MAG TPA: GMC oxidoreductase [Burkholderiales bacterium]|nr:GMC oxidoreductase [Burkholderiales bacterium]
MDALIARLKPAAAGSTHGAPAPGEPDGARFDAIVIGSGYGGSVAALRLAEQGLSVCLLERGREYTAGDFPNNLSELPDHVRIDFAGKKDPWGDDDALMDLRIGDETAVLLGSGLGGGSQINANVAIAPQPEIFLDTGNPDYAWPQAIQDQARAMQAAPGDADAGLARYYARARQTLGATRFPGVRQADGSFVQPQKSQQFDAAFETSRDADLTVRFEGEETPNPAGVMQSNCQGCGNCFTGCNFVAKGSLNMSYLPLAARAGARLYTGATVIGLRLEEIPVSPQQPPLQRWTVRFLPTRDLARRRLWNSDLSAPDVPVAKARADGLAQQDSSADAARASGDPTVYELSAAIVVVAAGSIGSTEILLHLQETARRAGAPLPFARALGERFSGNGDQLSFGYWQDAPVGAVGWSTAQEQAAAAPVGPTITRIAEIRGATPRESFLVQDGAVPGPIATVFSEITAFAGALTQLTLKSYKTSGNGGAVRDAVGLAPEMTGNTQVLLGIGHDQADGRIVLDANSNRAAVSWPSLKPAPGPAGTLSPADAYLRRVDAAMALVEELGAVYLSNPGWQPLPAAAQGLLSGPPLRNKLSIAHPLGGCVMADDAGRGVVNERGRVFQGESGELTYQGLYVLDGAMVNGSLGANPFLTICALTERALELEKPHLAALANRIRTGPGAGNAVAAPRELPPQPAPSPYFAPGRPAGIDLYEVLRNPLATADGRSINTSLMVSFGARDMAAWLGDPAHLFETTAAQLRLELPPADQPGGVPGTEALPAWVNYRSGRAAVQVLAPGANSWLMRALRLPAVGLTWLIARGYVELTKAKKQGGMDGGASVMERVVAGLKQAWHCTETRIMVYELDLHLQTRDEEAARQARYPAQFHLSGSKFISYAADWSALRPHLRAALLNQAQPRFLDRPNVWDSMTQLTLELRPTLRDSSTNSAAPWAAGVLKIDGTDMAQHLTPQVSLGDTSPGMVRLLGYPALFLRLLIKTRLWDLRLPDYGLLPGVHLDQQYPADELVARLIRPTHRLPILLNRKPEFRAFTVARSRDGSPYMLGLWRYRCNAGKPELSAVPGHGRTPDSQQCKSVLIAHAFGQSALSFAEPSIDGGVARAFLDQGWDVWLLETRISAALEGYDDKGAPALAREAARRPSTMDDIGGADIPAAVDLALGVLRRELGLATDAPLRMFAFAQCVGAASLAMATLSGKLSYDTAEQAQDKSARRRLSKIAGLGLSQFVPFPVGDPDTQMRTGVPAMLSAAGLSGINFSTLDSVRQSVAEGDHATSAGADYRAVAGEQTSMPAADSLIDRVLASFPVPQAELRHDQGWGRGMDHASATCRRIVGIEAVLFAERNLSDATHVRMPILFGHANIDLFNHARKCVEYERLVDNDGRNVYCTQDNILRHMHMPVGLLHGIDNRLFHISSSVRTANTLLNIFGDTAGGVCLMQIEGYGHLDSIIGEHADRDVYGHLTRYFADAWTANIEGRPVDPGLSVPPNAAQEAAGEDGGMQSRVGFHDSVWETPEDALEGEFEA